MLSLVELKRVWEEWQLRLQRVQHIFSPPSWDEEEWRRFARGLTLLVRKHGASWIIDPTVYWDLRWNLQGGGELICQVEHLPDERTSLVVAQTGGFASTVGSYTWLWAEFDVRGNFARDPYWVDGTWKEALLSLLTPLQARAPYYLGAPTSTPPSLLLQEGARPNPDAMQKPFHEDSFGMNAPLLTR